MSYFLNLKPGSEKGGRTTAILDTVMNLCTRSGNDWYRVYLIRKICSQHGVEFVLKQLKEDQMRWLFPEIVLQYVSNCMMVRSQSLDIMLAEVKYSISLFVSPRIKKTLQ